MKVIQLYNELVNPSKYKLSFGEDKKIKNMLKRLINETHYRMKLRKELQNSPIEVIQITIDEGKREYDRRQKELTKRTNKRK